MSDESSNKVSLVMSNHEASRTKEFAASQPPSKQQIPLPQGQFIKQMRSMSVIETTPKQPPDFAVRMRKKSWQESAINVQRQLKLIREQQTDD